MKINKKLLEFETENLFSTVTKKVNEYKEANKDKKIISFGIGDVSRPIIKEVADAMKNAVDDLQSMETFKGYGAYYGYDFLRKAIKDNDYKNIDSITYQEIYVSNGTKTDSTNILEMFDNDAKILINDPMYPIYRDGAMSLGRNVYTLKIYEKDNFVPQVPEEKYDVIYICSPCNPVGIALTREDLQKWIDYALKNDSVILYDNVYNSFIESEEVPQTIYELKNAEKVAIEFRTFSKNASFSGVRCSYYVVPNELYPNINEYWKTRTLNRFNGADYIAQCGAKEVYNQLDLIKENISYYKENAKILKEGFIDCGFSLWGGIDSPYLWVKTKDNKSSWEMFDIFLKKLNIIIIPGIIFGINGDGYFRVSALGNKENNKEAIERMKKYFKQN